MYSMHKKRCFKQEDGVTRAVIWVHKILGIFTQPGVASPFMFFELFLLRAFRIEYTYANSQAEFSGAMHTLSFFQATGHHRIQLGCWLCIIVTSFSHSNHASFIITHQLLEAMTILFLPLTESSSSSWTCSMVSGSADLAYRNSPSTSLKWALSFSRLSLNGCRTNASPFR